MNLRVIIRLTMVLVFLGACSTPVAQPTPTAFTPTPVPPTLALLSVPTAGRWEGEPSVSFNVVADGVIKDFRMTAPYPPTTCNIVAKEIPIEKGGTFLYAVSPFEGGAFKNRVQGKFDSTTTVAGTFLVQHCGSSVISGAKESVWNATWKGP